jgi:hypothetical protein
MSYNIINEKSYMTPEKKQKKSKELTQQNLKIIEILPTLK